ncbi:MAG: pseudouridine synthase [Spirochaetales bacterium]|nr:pseudouridine synthase [Spirochaetales bacterium]
MTILYEDDYLFAINKPRDMHVHPTKMSRGETSVQAILEEERGIQLFPAHRLDRPVGGILLIAKERETASALGLAVRSKDSMDKRYLCVVRGWMEGAGVEDSPMRQAPGKPEREASTRWRGLATAEAPWSDGVFPTSRYSLVECILETGRFHQIRRHMARSNHPILGDIPHGDNPRNKIWREQTGLEGMMLRAHRLSFIHPKTGERISLTAPPDERFLQVAKRFSWEESLVLE